MNSDSYISSVFSNKVYSCARVTHRDIGRPSFSYYSILSKKTNLEVARLYDESLLSLFNTNEEKK